MKGRIANGVLTTEPIHDLVIPWMNLGVPTFQLIRDMRLQLRLASTGAQGLIAGYADVDTWRSEEHTSELQSLMRNSYAVFGLKTHTKHSKTHTTPPTTH